MLRPHLWADLTAVSQSPLWLLPHEGGGHCSASLRNGISGDW